MRRFLVLGALAAVPNLLAQTPADIAKAAETITGADLARHIGVIADDSMMGRDTPSRGLESTAQYVASQFQALGLKPAGNDGTWFQRYQLPTRIDFAKSRMVFATGDEKAVASFTTGARVALRTVPRKPPQMNVTLVAGLHTPESLERAKVRGKTILYIAPAKPDTANWNQVREWLGSAANGLIILNAMDSATFARGLEAAMRRPAVDFGDNWAVSVRPEAVKGLEEVLRAAGVDLAQARANTPITRDLPSLQISLELQLDRAATDSSTAPNVIGVIEGSDPKLKEEFVIFSAHMDHTGLSRDPVDSINNGANDNASGTAGLIELAKAFAQGGVRPRRSVAFVATSGGAKELWGSRVFTSRLAALQSLSRMIGFGGLGGNTGFRVVFSGNQVGVEFGGNQPSDRPTPINIARVAANITLDMIGRNAQDTVLVNGLGDVSFATPPMWTVAAHPELGLTVVDDGTAIIPVSDHLAFIQQGIPSLYFHADDHRNDARADTLDTVDAEYAARVLRLAYYVGRTITDADVAPRWTTDGRRRYLQTLIN